MDLQRLPDILEETPRKIVILQGLFAFAHQRVHRFLYNTYNNAQGLKWESYDAEEVDPDRLLSLWAQRDFFSRKIIFIHRIENKPEFWNYLHKKAYAAKQISLLSYRTTQTARLKP